MDSQPGIGRGPNKRITRSWYPGGQACTNRTTRLEAAAAMRYLEQHHARGKVVITV